MSDTDTWMPLYVADYLKDTRHLSTMEHGAYFLLLMEAWIKRGELPADETRLARIAGLSSKEWKDSAGVLLGFLERNGDTYRHKRIDAELARATANVEQRRAAGKASAAARTRQRNGNGRSTSVDTSVATDGPTAGPTKCQRNGRPSPYTIDTPSTDVAGVSERPLPSVARQPDTPPPKSPIPQDWRPTPDDLAYVAVNCLPPWPAEKLKRVHHEFVAHQRSRGNLSADWSAEWRRWCLRQRRFDQPGDDEPDSGYAFRDPILRALEDEMGA